MDESMKDMESELDACEKGKAPAGETAGGSELAKTASGSISANDPPVQDLPGKTVKGEEPPKVSSGDSATAPESDLNANNEQPAEPEPCVSVSALTGLYICSAFCGFFALVATYAYIFYEGGYDND